MSGRHRKPNRGLPPLISGAGIAAVLVATVVLARPADIPDQPLPFPAPVLQLTPPAPAPDTTTAQAETTAPTSPAPLSTSLAPAPRPTATTSSPVVTAEPEPPVPPAGAPQSRLCEGLGVLPQVKRACNQIVAAVPGVKVIGGRGLRPHNPTSCHPLGLALDFMVYNDRALGDRIVAYVRAHKAELGVTTILWRVPQHWDHPHFSFEPCHH